jgi:[protein-PII] uridylyltransferase
MDDPYWLSFDAGAIAWHAAEADKVISGAALPHVAARPRPEHGVTEIMVVAQDRRGLFGSLAAGCASIGADIADARAEAAPGGLAFSAFSVQSETGGPFAAEDPSALATLCARLRRAAREGPPPQQRRAASRRHAAFAIAPWVKFDNQLALSATVVEVSGRDRPGLLAALALALADSGAMIASAHIGSYGERVSDVFYVTDDAGEKITAPRALAALRAALLAVLKEGDPDAPSDPAKQPLAVAQASEAR